MTTYELIEKALNSLNKLPKLTGAVTIPVNDDIYDKLDLEQLKNEALENHIHAEVESWLNPKDNLGFVNITFRHLEEGEVVFVTENYHKTLKHLVIYKNGEWIIRRENNIVGDIQYKHNVNFALVADIDIAKGIAFSIDKYYPLGKKEVLEVSV